jgi:glutathione S-transferase
VNYGGSVTQPNPTRDPSQPLSPSEIAKLQNNRTAAQSWLDATEVDVVKARQKLEQFETERRNAREALEAATAECERELRLAHNPVAGRAG